jgi:hypothetical protein
MTKTSGDIHTYVHKYVCINMYVYIYIYVYYLYMLRRSVAFPFSYLNIGCSLALFANFCLALYFVRLLLLSFPP